MDKSIAVENIKSHFKPLLNCDIAQVDFYSLFDSSISYAENKSAIYDYLVENGLVLNSKVPKEDIKAFADDIKALEIAEKEALKEVYTPQSESMDFRTLFNKPKVIGLIANTNEGKSNLIYHILFELKALGASLYAYGLKKAVKGVTPVYSLTEIEQVKDSILVIDEFFSLFDLDNRKEKRAVESSLRLINHNNNIILLAGMPENMKKFVSAKINVFIYKKSTISDFINGSRAKNVLWAYKGKEMGSSMLEMPINEALIFDGTSYSKIKIPYIKGCDTKAENKPLLKSVLNSVPKRSDVPVKVDTANKKEEYNEI